MLTHAVFADLLLHADDELAALLGAAIVERRTIHEWPLSCVQRVSLEDGRTLVYKSQRQPTVEAAFYARAQSTLLPGHHSLGRLGDCDILTIDWIDAPLLRDVARSDADLIDHGRRVIAQIGRLQSDRRAERHGDSPTEIRGDSDDSGHLPVYLDVGSRERWREYAAVTLEKARTLVGDGRFRAIDLAAIARVASWSGAAEVLDAISASSRLTHGDLKSDQVFVTPDGYRVIDWQRPVIAPAELDLVSLLAEDRREPRPFVDVTIVQIFWFLRLGWAVEAQHDLFPDFAKGPFDTWAGRAVRRILHA